MKFLKIISISLLLLFLYSCNSNEDDKGFTGKVVEFGTAEYYEPFSWVKSDTVILEKKLKFQFNDFAKQNNSFIKIIVTDEEGAKLDNSNIQLFVNDRYCKDGTIGVYSDSIIEGELKIGLKFMPGFDKKNVTGYIKILSTDLDRINSNELNASNEKRLFKWAAEYKVGMNPLKKVLLWSLFIIISVLLTWFVVLRNIVYPKMGKGTLVIQGPFSARIKAKGARKVVFTDKIIKQSRFNRIFAGKIIYQKNNFWEEPLVLYPFRKRTLRLKLSKIYIITPYSSTIQRGRNYELKKNKISFKLSYL
jgi:hypothetical protein